MAFTQASLSLSTIYSTAFLLLALCNLRDSVASMPEQHTTLHNTPEVLTEEAGSSAGNLPGHLKPLGSHRPEEKPGIDVLDRVPEPLVFFNNYVKDGKPVIFKGAARDMASYKLWTDDYLSERYGHLSVEVEEGKKENRSKDLWDMPLSQFIKKYKEEDVYLVTDVPPVMADELGLLRCLLCGGFTSTLHDIVLWYSSGGTKSVLHFDGVDNINCIMDGRKEIFLVDKKEKANIDIDHPREDCSLVDVDKVDLNKYPGLGQVPWYNATLEKGDCVFIPYRWFHAVRSWGRNLAVNVWFSHRLWFNESDCPDDPATLPQYIPLSSFKKASGLEILRSRIVNELADSVILTLEECLSKDIFEGSTKDQVTQFFKSLDEDGDGKLSVTEAYSEKFMEACKSAELSIGYEESDVEEEEEEDEGEEEQKEEEEDEESGDKHEEL